MKCENTDGGPEGVAGLEEAIVARFDSVHGRRYKARRLLIDMIAECEWVGWRVFKPYISSTSGVTICRNQTTPCG